MPDRGILNTRSGMEQLQTDRQTDKQTNDVLISDGIHDASQMQQVLPNYKKVADTASFKSHASLIASSSSKCREACGVSAEKKDLRNQHTTKLKTHLRHRCV